MVFESIPATQHFVDFGKVVAAELSLSRLGIKSFGGIQCSVFFILASPFKHAILPPSVEWRVNGMMDFFTSVSGASFVPNLVWQAPTASSALPITIHTVAKGRQMSGLRRRRTRKKPLEQS